MGTDSVARVAIVGAGPRAISVLERMSASAPELLGDRRLTVHLIDPFPPGPGRIWRYEQSPLMRMNSMPKDVTMFTDDSVRMAGPVRPGPSLAQWVQQVRDGELAGVQLSPDVAAEVAELAETGFPTRRLQSAYLGWVYRQVLAGLPAGMRVEVHADRAVRLTESGDSQQIRLAGGAVVHADAVLLAVGHLDVAPDEGAQRLVAYAAEHDLRYYPAGYTADIDYSAVPAGETALVRGFGLAFVDLVKLLTEGRGGRFADGPDGTLRYLPSGREPVLHVGSRRGVPYHAKPGYWLQGDQPDLPRFFDDTVVQQLVDRPGTLDFRADVWPLMAKEIAWGYYHELCTGHPDRVTLAYPEFAAAYAAADWGSAAMAELVQRAVPAQEDRFDLDAIDRPLRGLSFDDAEQFDKYLCEYVRADLARRADAAYSADLGAFLALLSVYGRIPPLVAAAKFAPAAQLLDVDGWWIGFFGFFASGPPPRRLVELLALRDAGVVSFAGPEMWVSTTDGVFAAGSPAVGGEVRARTLIEGMLPAPSVCRAADPLLRSLFADGALSEGDDEPPSGRIRTRVQDGRLLDAHNAAHPRRFSLGPHTSARSPAAFTRPGVNALPFRHSDATAREILLLCRESAG